MAAALRPKTRGGEAARWTDPSSSKIFLLEVVSGSMVSFGEHNMGEPRLNGSHSVIKISL